MAALPLDAQILTEIEFIIKCPASVCFKKWPQRGHVIILG